MTLIGDVFPKLRTLKYVVKQMSQNSSSEHPLTSNMVRGPNTVETLTAPPLPHFLIILKAIHLEKIVPSAMQILRNVCCHIASR